MDKSVCACVWMCGMEEDNSLQTLIRAPLNSEETPCSFISLTEAVLPEGRRGHKEKPRKQKLVRVSTPLLRSRGKAPAS